MKDRFIRNVLVVVVVFLFLGLTFQPITSITTEQYSNSKNVEKIKPFNDIKINDYLYDSIITILNYPIIENYLNNLENNSIYFENKFEISKILGIKTLIIFDIFFKKPAYF